MRPQVVLVTGCSSGFGLLLAVLAAKKGHRVFATMRDLSRRGDLDRACAQAGVAPTVLELDVDRGESIARAVAQVEREAGRVDALVNNAGYGQGGALESLSMDELRAQFETNFFGPMALAKAVLPGMLARGDGCVVQVSSIGARHPTPGLGAYSASKAALDTMTDALRMEVASRGVRVTSVQPGMFRTEIFRKARMAQGALEQSSPWRELALRTQQRIDALVRLHADDPRKVAERIVQLVEDPDPPPRVIMGRDAWAETAAHALLPERMWQALVRRAAGEVPGVTAPGKPPRG